MFIGFCTDLQPQNIWNKKCLFFFNYFFFNYLIYFKAHKPTDTSTILRVLLLYYCRNAAVMKQACIFIYFAQWPSIIYNLCRKALQHVLRVTQRHSHIVWFLPLQRKTCCIFKAPEIGTKSKREWKTMSKERKQPPHKPKAERVLLHFCCCFLILLLGHHTLE